MVGGVGTASRTGSWSSGTAMARGGTEAGGGLVNGILLGHPFTRTRRKLEDLIWRLYGWRSPRQCRLLNHWVPVIYVCMGSYISWFITQLSAQGSKLPESAQIDKRNNRGREIEGLDLIRRGWNDDEGRKQTSSIQYQLKSCELPLAVSFFYRLDLLISSSFPLPLLIFIAFMRVLYGSEGAIPFEFQLFFINILQLQIQHKKSVM